MAKEPLRAQEGANVLKKDPESDKLVITDEARKVFVDRTKEALMTGNISLPFPCLQSIPVLDFAKNIDLHDREKYPDFHKFWVDGMYASVARSLNLKSNFAIPVFDPIALGLKLGIDPIPDLDLISIAASFAAPIPLSLQLLNIKPPKLPDLGLKALNLVIPIPELPKFEWELPNVNFLPFGAIDVKLALLNLPFLDLFKQIALPSFWLDFTLFKLFELSCKTMTGAVTKPFNSAPVKSPPITGLAAASALASCTADCASFAVTGTTIGVGAVVQKEAENRSYTPPKTEKSPSLNTEAALNGLYPFEPSPAEDGASWVFSKGPRNTYFGDPFVIDYLYALGAHMKSKRSDFVVPDYVVEVGNITGKDSVKGWRWSKWSVISKGYSSHFGSAFDFAYPMKNGNSRTSGMNTQAKAVTGEAEGGTGESPYLPQPNKALTSDKYDFEVLYEILTWTNKYVQDIIDADRIGPSNPWSKSKKLALKDVFVSLTIGEQVYKYFQNWANKNGKSLKGIPFDPNKSHEDHLHFRWTRTRIDSEKTSQDSTGKVHYFIPWNVDAKYPKESRGVESKKLSSPEDPTKSYTAVV